jgi:PAS domain S-box-containing protein
MQNEELRRTQLELEEQRARYFELFDLAPVGYLTIDARGVIGDANFTAAHLLGVERQLLAGQPFSAFILAPDRDVYYLHQRTLQKSGEPQSCDLRLLGAGGDAENDHFWARLEGQPQHGADGEPPGCWVTFSDVTEQKKAEAEIRRLNAGLEERVATRTAQLETANKELEAFAYSVSHDLRAPLRAIDGFSQMVVEDAGDRLATEDLEHLQRVRAAAQHMAKLIDDLLGLSRASRMDLHREEVDVSAMASSVLDELRDAQPQRRVEITVAPGMRAEADAQLLHIILVNLLTNAWKFTSRHEEAHIEVGVSDSEGSGDHHEKRAFFVRDDGAGFAMDRAPQLFGAFQRLHAADEFEGDGIGLATVQRLVLRHGGRIWAEAGVEKGATFFFTLPGGE